MRYAAQKQHYTTVKPHLTKSQNILEKKFKQLKTSF